MSYPAWDEPLQIRDWLRRTLVDETGRLPAGDFDDLARLARWNTEEHEVDQQHDGPSMLDRAARSAVTVGRAFVAVADIPFAAPLMVLYLRWECEQAWEVSWHHEPIRQVIEAARHAWGRIVEAGVRVADPELTGVALDHLQILDCELTVETAASCASLALWADHARRTAILATKVKAAAGRAAAATPDEARHSLADHLGQSAHLEAMYYDAVALAAEAVHGHFSAAKESAPSAGVAVPRTTGESDVDIAIRCLRDVEDHPGVDDIDRSELRAHRYNLEALRAGADQPWLEVAYGKVAYLYPFGLRGVGPVAAVDTLRESGSSWILAGLPVDRVAQDLLLNDIWKGDDPLQRQYRGAAVHLPDLLVPDPDSGQPHTVAVELRLSELGNHYLRLEAPLEQAGPHHVYAAMLRAAPEFGDLTELELPIRPAGTERRAEHGLAWGQLAEFANEVIGDVAAELREHGHPEATVSGRPGMYHVMVTVERARAMGGAGPEPLATAGELTATLGAQPLCHPVRHGISSVAEWLRYPVEDLPVVDAPGFREDLMLRTGNTTLIVIPGSPNYMIFAVEEAAEFVATLDGLFAGWQDELADYYSHVRPALADMIAQLDHGGRGPDPDSTAEVEGAVHGHTTAGLVYTQAWLEQQQLRLHEFVMASRLTLMFITSPALVTSPVVRLTLDRLLAAAGFDRLRDQFVGMVEQVLGGRLAALIEASVRRRQEWREAMARIAREETERTAHLEREREEAVARAAAEREERQARSQRRRMDTLLAVIAAVGVSGLAQILQAGYDIRETRSFALAALVVTTAAAFGAYVHWISGRRAGHDDRSAKEQVR